MEARVLICSWPVHREAERVAYYVRLMATPAVKP